MAVITRIHLLLILAAAHLTFQSPLNYVENRPETMTHPIIVSPVSGLDIKAINSNENRELDPSELATMTNKQLSSSVLEAQASPSLTTLYIKTSASDCNIEGSLGSTMKVGDYTAKSTDLNSVLDCQLLCQRTATCYSYSWQTTNENACRCTMYSTWIGHTPGAVNSGKTGLWFSDKHVVDGTVWCYSSTPFMASGLPGTPIIITRKST